MTKETQASQTITVAGASGSINTVTVGTLNIIRLAIEQMVKNEDPFPLLAVQDGELVDKSNQFMIAWVIKIFGLAVGIP